MPYVIGEVEVTNEVSLAPSAVLYDGSVVADGDLTVQVHSFYYDMSGTKGKYAGSVNNSVTDDDVNYVYLDPSTNLAINTTGYPSGEHIRLARVVASGGFITRIILERAFLTSATNSSGMVPSSRQINTSGGLQGGGDLTSNRTISPIYGSTSSTVCEGNDSRLTSDRIASGLRTTTTVVSVSGATAPIAGNALVALSGTAASWVSLVAGSDGWIQFNDDGVFGATSNFIYDKTSGTLTIGPATIFPNNPLDIAGNLDSYLQVIIQNKNSGTSASTDLCLTSDDGDDTTNFIDVGINGSGYADLSWSILGANDGYMYVQGNNLCIGTDTSGKYVKFFTGGTTSSELRVTIDDTGINLPSGESYRINNVALPLLTSSAPADVTKDTASVGVATSAARSDHKHNISTATASSITVGGSNAEGTATSLSRSDHNHAIAAFGSTSGTFCQGNDSRLSDSRNPTSHASTHNPGGTDAVSTGTPSTIGTSNSEGIATSLARSDHVHNHGNLLGGSTHAVATTGTAGFLSSTDKTKLDGISSGATNTPLSSSAPANVTKSSADVGVDTSAARSDHKHDVSTATAGSVTIGASASEGTATSLSRSDHVHSVGTPGSPVNVTKATADAGTSTTPARSDHKHDVTTATAGAAAIGDSAAEGTATSLARSDHKHSVSAGTPVAVGTSNASGSATTFSRSDHVHDTPFSVIQTVLGGASGAISVNSQNLTSVGTINGWRNYGPNSSNPSSPSPSVGDFYYNTSIECSMFYDGTRSKWLGSELISIYAGASGATAAGSFFRGVDSLAFGTNRGIPVLKGTVTGMMVSMTTNATSTVELLVDTTVIATLNVTTAGLTADLTLNADFNQGLMKFRNISTGATMNNVQITAQIKRRP